MDGKNHKGCMSILGEIRVNSWRLDSSDKYAGLGNLKNRGRISVGLGTIIQDLSLFFLARDIVLRLIELR